MSAGRKYCSNCGVALDHPQGGCGICKPGKTAPLARIFESTCGEWRVSSDGFDGWEVRGEPAGEYIDGKPVDQSVLLAEGITDADVARLMAAAPELLNALQAFVEPWNAGRSFAEMDADDCRRIQGRANAAIAKVLGK